MKLFKDPLLGISWVLLTAFLALFTIGAVLIFLSAFAIPFVPHQIEAGIAPQSDTSVTQASWAIVGFSLFTSAFIASFAWFTYLLHRIVLSVVDGDPFVLANAKRLNAMAWLTVAISVAVPAFISATHQITELLGEKGIEGELGFGANGILLALVLFILARVFRHGAAMREDLEGTV